MDASLDLTNLLEFSNSQDDQDDFPTRCPHCHTDEPGFIDALFDECPVECEQCGHVTILAVWAETAWRAQNGVLEVVR